MKKYSQSLLKRRLKNISKQARIERAKMKSLKMKKDLQDALISMTYAKSILSNVELFLEELNKGEEK